MDELEIDEWPLWRVVAYVDENVIPRRRSLVYEYVHSSRVRTADEAETVALARLRARGIVPAGVLDVLRGRFEQGRFGRDDADAKIDHIVDVMSGGKGEP